MSRYDWPSNPGVEEEEKDDPRGRTLFKQHRRLDFDLEGALRAARAAAQPAQHPPGTLAPDTTSVNLWQPLGPETLLNGQAEGDPRVSGRVNALAVHPDGLRAYAASANGGIWYTLDGGDHWISVGGFSSTNTAGIDRPVQRNACGAIYVEFGAAEGDDLVFVGTGEVTHGMGGQPGNSEGGIGILRSQGPTLFGLDEPWTREAPNLVNNGVYRIARDPDGPTIIAATRTGLFQRPDGAGAETNWVRPTGTPFDTLNSDCTDLLWTPGDSATSRPARLWVWVRGNGGDAPGLYVRDAGAADFTPVAIDGASPIAAYSAGRARLAASTPPTQVWLLSDRGNGIVPDLFRVTNPITGAGRPVANGVVGVPDIVGAFGFYCIAMAVHPTNPNRVAVGGSILGNPNNLADRPLITTEDDARRRFDASIVVADVAPDPANAGRLTYGHPTPFTMIGIGVHPDVHALVYSNNGDRLWTACDGGVFRSDRPTRPAGFFPRNNGLSISETNFVAVHPSCEGHLVAGLQDNGVVERASNSVWFVRNKGDGGGVVLDANRPDRWLFQHTRGDWRRSLPGGTGPIRRQNNLDATENPTAAFYSSAANIANVRTAAPTNFSQTIVGTNRVWYTADFGVGWRTLPSGTDPLGPAPHNYALDAFGEAITHCRWQSPDVAWIMGASTLMRYARTPGSHNAGGTGIWNRTTVIQKTAATALDMTNADGPIRNTQVWTEIAVNLDPPPAAGQPPAQHGAQGAVYLGTIGNPASAAVDTLWWFDGDGQWFHTNLRAAVPAPVTSIVCDPNFPNEVYVGTTVGVWRGVRTQPVGGTPTWAWAARLNGLPEATVEDLALFSDPASGLRLLRAAIAARGIWELRLDVAAVASRTYVRAHGDDQRYRDRSIDQQRDQRTTRSWHASPDVRPRRAPAAVPAPAALTSNPLRRATFSGTDTATEQLRRFQAAMRSSTGDPRIVANGKWDGYFSEVLRDHGAPTTTLPAAGVLPERHPVRITTTFWNQHMVPPHDTAEPWGAGTPTEADLYELTPRLVEGDRRRASCRLRNGDQRVEVVVHHRGLGTVNGATVRVTLLRWLRRRASGVSNPDNANTWFTGDVPWTAAVNEVLNSADGITNQVFGGNWEFVIGTPATSRRLDLTGQTLDSFHSGVVTFNLNLPRLGNSDYTALLVAVIRAGTSPADDIALAPATLQNLALGSPHVAVRSVRVLH